MLSVTFRLVASDCRNSQTARINASQSKSEGDRVTDLHLWRLGPGHLGAIVSVATNSAHEAAHYRQRLAKFADLSHVTAEVQYPSSSA